MKMKQFCHRGEGGGLVSEPPEPPLNPLLKFVTQDHPTWESINDTVTMQTVQYGKGPLII